jgi:hypothetical protein
VIHSNVSAPVVPSVRQVALTSQSPAVCLRGRSYLPPDTRRTDCGTTWGDWATWTTALVTAGALVAAIVPTIPNATAIRRVGTSPTVPQGPADAGPPT